jgi:hypothetical protein
MYKKVIFSLIFALLLISSAAPALAQYGLQKTGTGAGYKQSNLFSYISTGISAFLGLIAIIFFGMTLYSGIRWMTARGNPELSEKAKNALEAAVIGLVITIMSYAIATFVLGRFIK